MRTYGKFEPLYTESRKLGSVFLKFAEDAPPTVARADDGGLAGDGPRPADRAASELAIPVDLVVLVTGMVPRKNEELIGVLKLPVGTDGFFNEIHPKLRPVETVVDGVLIAGACQGPKTSARASPPASPRSPRARSILKKGFAELDPLVAIVHADACTACGACLDACPYDAIAMAAAGDRQVAVISETGCKGCGGCVPLCPENAIDLLGYTDAQVTAMIDSLRGGARSHDRPESRAPRGHPRGAGHAGADPRRCSRPSR